MKRPFVTLVAVAALGVGAYLVENGGDDSAGDGESAVDDAASSTSTAPASTAPPTTAPGATAPGATTPPPAGAETATVKRVHDGDSFDAVLSTGQEVDVRMLGLNAPEFGECVSVDARKTLGGLLGKGQFQLVRDVTDRDRYQRLLRYVIANEVLVNREMIARGLALATSFEPDVAHEADFAVVEQQAQNAGAGLWNPNACGPAASTAVTIVEVEEDPPGRDSDDLNGEYVVVRNGGDTPVLMTGWKLRDRTTQNRFWFPDGFTLGAGQQVTVRVGAGQNGRDVLYWGRRSTVWDNDGDTAFLLDPKGNAVSNVDVPMR